jgi:hypothetical protein
MAQSQPSDIGFGYISYNDSIKHDQGIPVEMPQTPGSPLKSAMKLPGAPRRVIDNPLSPTFREEQILEKNEEWTEKEQAKDLVGSDELLTVGRANHFTESQDSGTDSKGFPSCHKLLLQPDRRRHGRNNHENLLRHPTPTSTEQPSGMGQRDQDMAADCRSFHRLCISCILLSRILRLLERRTQTGRENRSLLHHLRRRVLYFQHRHVGCCSWYSPKHKIQFQQSRHLGLVLRRKQKKAVVPGQG